MHTSITLAASVDLLIVGGSLGAVNCALAAARSGLRVLLAAPRHGLADDIADTWRLDAEAPIADALAAAVFPDGQCPSPGHARRLCEQALLQAGVELLLGVLPCGLVYNEERQLRGLILAHRAGRSAIQAQWVVDATATACCARLAGLHFDCRQEPLSIESRLLVAADQALAGRPLGQRSLSPAMPDCRLIARVNTYSLPSYSAPELLAVEARRQLEAFDDQAIALSPWGHLVLPISVEGAALAQWRGAESVHVDLLRSPLDGLWLLNGCVASSQEAAVGLLAPAALSRLGERLGAVLAEQDRPQQTACRGLLPGSSFEEELRGQRGGLRHVHRAELPSIPLDDGQAPLFESVDVLVVGGGTGGAPAGIAAAREGARTLVIERLQRLGGVGTLGRIGRYWFGNRQGFTAEVDQRVFAGYGEPRFPERNGAWWVLEHKQDAWLRMLQQAQGQAWFGCTSLAALMDGQRCVGSLIASEHGAGIIRAKALVDASGSADLAAAAGAPCRLIDHSHIAVQGTGLSPAQPEQDYQNSDHDFCDDTDPYDVTRLHLRSRIRFADAWDTAALVDSRERRQIQGRYELTPLDICCDRHFPDAIARACSNFDSHGFTIHPVFTAFPMNKKPMWAWIPYRCLQPQGIENILVVGLGMSAHRDALPVVRMQADVQNTGFSAGVAAALAVASGCSCDALDVSQLQERLVALQHLDSSVLSLEDSFPLPQETVREMIREDLSALKSIAAAFAAGPELWPDLIQRLSHPSDAETAAIILGLQGCEAAAPSLRQLLAERAWDEGWRFTGMGQFGRSLSPVDTRLLALAYCGNEQDAAIIVDFAAALDADPELSHCRALALSAQTLIQRYPQTADGLSTALLRILNLPGISGHAQSNMLEAIEVVDPSPVATREREECLRELHLAAAAWRCGARAQTADILESYAQDLRGHYARHAQAVLAEGSDT